MDAPLTPIIDNLSASTDNLTKGLVEPVSTEKKRDGQQLPDMHEISSDSEESRDSEGESWRHREAISPLDTVGYVCLSIPRDLRKSLDDMIRARTSNPDVVSAVEKGYGSGEHVILNHRNPRGVPKKTVTRRRCQYKLIMDFKVIRLAGSEEDVKRAAQTHRILNELKDYIFPLLGRGTTLFAQRAQVYQPVVIVSLPDCPEQILHTDYAPSWFAYKDYCMYPLGVIYSYEGCTIDVVERSINMVPNLEMNRSGTEVKSGIHRKFISEVSSMERKRITLKAGEVFVFRGDLIHAGSSYTSMNTRMHFYVWWGPETGISQNFLCERSHRK